ncbi:hypothetical protein [Chitinimonas taiwanensis]|uniref:hypothetical protein n=1 Tax=Chitinimonas taiwanensis TaxID=240412 RepID=UPI00160EADF8
MLKRSADLAVVINLDYLSLPYDTCRMLWLIIERTMLEAGFELEGRVFVARRGVDVIHRAKQVMQDLEPTFQSLGYSGIEAVRDFYCYERATRIDLNTAEPIEVVEIQDIPVSGPPRLKS